MKKGRNFRQNSRFFLQTGNYEIYVKQIIEHAVVLICEVYILIIFSNIKCFNVWKKILLRCDAV